ncbi:hypothetical protein ACH41E_03435 [Streptomyces sp. NPDC020412]|uniref:hypothetical protein n=1 Tax=Streptomyces sp. NPDC020412 TaxID=3365073 RepID=UPI0037A35403
MARSWRSDLLPFSRIRPCSRTPTANSSNTAAVERYLTCACIAKSATRVYRVSPTAWGWTLTGEPAPTGPARRGAKPPVFPVAAVNDPAPPEVLAELAAARAGEMDAGTVNRELSIARKAIGWWQRQGWIECDPTLGIERRPATPCARPGVDSVARHVARLPADRVGGKGKAAQHSDLPAPNSTDGSHGRTSDLLAADDNRAGAPCPPSPTVLARNAVDASPGQWAAPSSPAPDGSRRRARRPRR